jgi:hypothetical protein
MCKGRDVHSTVTALKAGSHFNPSPQFGLGTSEIVYVSRLLASGAATLLIGRNTEPIPEGRRIQSRRLSATPGMKWLALLETRHLGPCQPLNKVQLFLIDRPRFAVEVLVVTGNEIGKGRSI